MMGRSVNKVTLIGTLGRDPEIKFMPNGNAVANISLATDESYTDKATNQKVEQTEWHRITAYGKLAEIIQQYLKKGSRAYIEGKLRTREWEKDGVKRYTTEIIASEMMMLDRAQETGGEQGFMQPQPQYQQQQYAQQQYQQAPAQQQMRPQQHPMAAHGRTVQPVQQYQQHQGNSFDSFDDDIPFNKAPYAG